MQTTIYSSALHKFFSALAIVAMVLVALPAAPAYAAATITVTVTTDDYTPIGQECSLREAIDLANSNLTNQNDCTRSNADADDIIVLQSGLTYTLTREGAGGTSVGDLDVGDIGATSGNLTIQASDPSIPAIIDGNDIDRVLDVDPAGNPSLTLIGITVMNGNTTGQTTTAGGGISFSGTGTLTVTNSTILNNISASGAGCGGGIYNNSAATVIITDSTISGNSCPTAGSDGGGLFKGGGGSLTITNSTFSGNSTAENGGGVHIGSLTGSTTSITNSTFANNTAGDRGGGLQVGSDASVVNVDFSTFSGNVANGVSLSTPAGTIDGGGALQAQMGSVTVTRSILANSAVTLGQAGTPADCDKGNLVTISVTDSIIETVGDCAVTVTSGDPLLGSLANNGGPTQTIAISTASPAYNSADSCGSSTTDQRGLTRPMVGACDLGSYELQDPTVPTVSSVVRAEPNPTNDPSIDFTVTFSESVTGVDAADFSLTTTGVTGASVSGVSGSGTTYTVTVNTGSGDGTIRLDVLDNDTIQDAGFNFLDGGFTAGEDYTVDKTAPTVSITRADSETMGTPTVDFGIAFSEAVTGVNTNGNDFELSTTGVSGASITGVTGLGTNFTATVNTGSGDGTIGLNLINGASVADAAGNQISGGSTGEVYIILKSSALVNVTIGASDKGNQNVLAGERVSVDYNINGGPVHVTSTNGLPIFTSERAIFGASFNSIVGYPGDQLTTDYWFTSYDDKGMITFLVIGNPHPTDTAEVDVFIGGNLMGHYSIAPGARVFPRYGINAGPVHVVSTNGVDIFTSERTRFGNSFNEVMGYPGNQLATDYWFTSYDDKGMITYLVVGNPHETLTAEVDVYIGGVKRNTTPYQIAPGQRIFPRFGINAGPVRVVSTNGVEVFTSERTRFGNTFNEVMGYPGDQVSTEFWFTSYDDTSMITFLVVGNPHETLTAEVDIYINGNKMNTTPYQIAPGQRVFPRFGINSGPVHVVSTNGVEVFASERSKYLNSFNEVLGLAAEQLATDYWFTSYDDVGMTTFLVIGAPE